MVQDRLRKLGLEAFDYYICTHVSLLLHGPIAFDYIYDLKSYPA